MHDYDPRLEAPPAAYAVVFWLAFALLGTALFALLGWYGAIATIVLGLIIYGTKQIGEGVRG